ncbi:MAG TPA: hypothetical protein VLQ78_13595, partial [Ornithinibacter sp.]|nr:hypothetical protein [Ornithinibacter sp.]
MNDDEVGSRRNSKGQQCEELLGAQEDGYVCGYLLGKWLGPLGDPAPVTGFLFGRFITRPDQPPEPSVSAFLAGLAAGVDERDDAAPFSVQWSRAIEVAPF